MNKKLMFRNTINLTLVLSLLFILLFSIKVSANHTDSEQYGSTTNFYGHFGQPTGTEVSGSYEFVASVTNNTDRVYFSVSNDYGKSTVLQDYTATSVLNGEGEDYYRLNLDTTQLENGEYQLYGRMECDDCTPNGIRDSIYHYVGTPYIKFAVNNVKIVDNEPTEPGEDFCEARLNEALKISENITNKHSATILFIDNFFSQTTNFYEVQGLDVETFDGTVIKVSANRKIASDDLVLLNSNAKFDCESSLKEQVNTFVEQSKRTRDNLDTYKDSVIGLIITLLGEL